MTTFHIRLKQLGKAKLLVSSGSFFLNIVLFESINDDHCFYYLVLNEHPWDCILVNFNSDKSPAHISLSLLHSANACTHRAVPTPGHRCSRKPEIHNHPTVVCMFTDLWSDVQHLFLFRFHIKHSKDQMQQIS